ncbi:pyridoxal phosphate-dependent aminotransferase [Clostridium sp. P21]|uniref:cysteine-S-conjugate beta-lyase n=1 Tax=Clostridium muellerianum TaxID=2716538 RepID=A0A7Y0HQM4_9CLOT|nr:MalY/PatB family protein [Clostridium muellerianum]NMM63963.1 pyridoxal phosphate-dependent aminotransferase [Clostridium muellerianum]
MKYNFDEVINRDNTNSVKWNFNKDLFGCEDVIPMWVADMDFKTVPEVTEAIVKRASHGIYGYSERTDDYFDAVISWMKKRHDLDIKKEWILSTSGIVPAINFIIKTFTNKGDKILVQSPVYYPFYNAIKNNECEIVYNALKFDNEKYTMDFEDLEQKAKDSKVKIMILCNPHNPVGRVWSKDELFRLGKICAENDVLVISDEIHSDLIYKEFKHTSFAAVSEDFRKNSIICTAPSKTFNLAGLQVSNLIIFNKDLRDRLETFMSKLEINKLNLFAIIACEAAYKYGEQWLDELIEYLGENKNFLKNFIKKRIPKLKVIEAEGTYLVWIDCRKLNMNKEQLKEFMISKAGIAFDEGFIFGPGGEGFERINIACPRSTLEKALERMEQAINNLKSSDS